MLCYVNGHTSAEAAASTGVSGVNASGRNKNVKCKHTTIVVVAQMRIEKTPNHQITTIYCAHQHTHTGTVRTIQEQKFIKPKQISRPGPTFTFSSAHTHTLCACTHSFGPPFFMRVCVLQAKNGNYYALFSFSMAVLLFHISFSFFCVHGAVVCAHLFPVNIINVVVILPITLDTCFSLCFWWISAPAQ